MTAGKDWTGNWMSVKGSMGASGHFGEREANDYYATEPKAAELLLQIETLAPNIWECACGEGHLSKVFAQNGYAIKSTDLIDRGYGQGGVDFLTQTEMFDGDIVTNPPYKYADDFIRKALELVPDGRKVIMFLKVQFLEGKARKSLYTEFPPRRVWISSSRLHCGKNGDITQASMVAYAWYVWEKGYKGDTILKWFN